VPELPLVLGAAPKDELALNPELVEKVLVKFLRQELAARSFTRAVVALSGGVDSAVVAALAARALGAEQVLGLRLPDHASQASSLTDAQSVAEWLGCQLETYPIGDMVRGYAEAPTIGPRRLGNVMARCRMIVLFDRGEAFGGLPLGTGNKTERLLGYYTWHDAGDAAPVNPLGDLFKTQVWDLARHLGVPSTIIDKAPTADLEPDQTDEGDLGIRYPRADTILQHLILGRDPERLLRAGFQPSEVALVRSRLHKSHWKRGLPAVAMVSESAIGEAYLRPIDFRDLP
jgi:NAD+ synthase